MWNLDDPFLYAPPIPEGDPWDLLLEPLLNRDKMRCDAWKEEVQNLLIFAGLFSAVVTAFIIESYKNLQPNPNDAIISLLSQIATRLDNSASTNVSGARLSTDNIEFLPTPSSIRVNTFWFLSLVLSLTTVLIGIVSLQWLREHQAYPNLTPKQMYALFNMRIEGLQKWHVPKIFTLLPLLLQTALVLFLGGIIDFLLAFGNVVVIPVGAVIGSTVFFMAATTVLPTIQGFLLYLPFPYFGQRLPVQCPYKSPQSLAFRAISRFGFQICSRLYPTLRHVGHQVVHYALLRSSEKKNQSDDDYFTRYILSAWKKRTWAQFDLAWLSVRDAYMRRAYRRATKRDNLGHDLEQHTPLFDIVQGLLKSIRSRKYETPHTEFSFAAEYYCLTEISDSVCSHWQTSRTCPRGDSQLQNAYFQDLLSGRSDEHICLSDFFEFTAAPELWEEDIEVTSPLVQKTIAALHHEAIFMFLSRVDQHHPLENLKRLSMHKLELKLRLMGHFYKETHRLLPSASLSQAPTCLTIDGNFEFRHEIEDDKRDVFLLQLTHVVRAYFKCVDNVLPKKSFHSHHHFPRFLYLAFVLLSSTPDYDMSTKRALHFRKVVYSSTFNDIAERLKLQMSFPPTEKWPSLLFYAAALYIREFAWYPMTIRPSLKLLISTMRKIKERTIDLGIVNEELEEILGQMVPTEEISGFSEQWWTFLDHQCIIPDQAADIPDVQIRS
ncbi:hypothetical protein GALMADRAFT_95066 [Galerina marginata CBS 339.88]|uniref:DUF6535 domain-containing protein n=1 Tax=Galerina marginata (strain CBS 339.88) TaxID=685588 RepID=A0A067T5H2_GALM3|nr:hypothetical protein GALMADRAFT_95066 [Galerina marginata CBS 339.88]